MKGYVKPLILASDDLAEGIFTASGLIGGAEEDAGGNAGGTAGAGETPESDPSEFAAPEIDTNAQADPGIAAPDNSGDTGSGDSNNSGDNGDTGIEAGTPDVQPPADTGKNYSLTLLESWDGNKKYDIRITNNSSETVSSVSAVIGYTGTVTAVAGNCTGTVNGDNTVTVVFSNYGNPIEPGATVGTDWLNIQGSGDFALVL